MQGLRKRSLHAGVDHRRRRIHAVDRSTRSPGGLCRGAEPGDIRHHRRFGPPASGGQPTFPALACWQTSSGIRHWHCGTTTPPAWPRPCLATMPGCRSSHLPGPSAWRWPNRGCIRWCLPAGWRQPGHPGPTAGSTLYLPVEVAGALLSIGDTHRLRATVKSVAPLLKAPWTSPSRWTVKDTPLAMPRFSTAGPVTATWTRRLRGLYRDWPGPAPGGP